MMRAIVVDDERSGREMLVSLLQRSVPELEVVAVADSVASARTIIREEKPALIFLDIELGDGTGFDLLASLDSVDFDVIFVTAYDHYAIQALRCAAVDYLLKPVDPEALRDAVTRAMSHASTRQSTEQRLQLLFEQIRTPRTERLALPTSEGYLFVQIADIIRCESSSNYTTFHLLNNRSIMVSHTLGEYEAILSEHGFFRVHHSSLVNINRMERYVKGKGGYVVMSDGSQVDVSVRRKERFLETLSTR
jgi:two-component system LytT family response regulator